MLLLLAFALAAAPASEYEDGVARIARGDLPGAIAALTRATQQDSANAKAWKALGVAYASSGQYAAAEPAFGQACKLAPKLEDACYYHARALYALNRFEPSLAALAHAGNGWRVRLAAAQAEEALGRDAEAEAHYRAALKAPDPSPAAAFGQFLIRQGRSKEARAVLEPSVERFPNNAASRIQLARVLLEANEAQSAIQHLERAVAAAPTSSQAHLLLAKAYTRAGRTAEARPHFEAAARYEAASQGMLP